MKKDILLIGGTHGNEPIGVEALKQLEKRTQSFDWIIGSPPALEAGTREYEGDLNRSAPGNKNAATYAERRAAEIIEMSKQYRYTIDLHGTSAYTGIFVIVTNPKPENIELARRLHAPRVVLWPSFSPELDGAISEHVRCGVEIECGPKEMPRIQTSLVDLLETFIRQADEEATEPYPEPTFYEVYGSLRNTAVIDSLEEFTEASIDHETFYPLLIGRYQERNGITCYKMRKINIPAGFHLKENTSCV